MENKKIILKNKHKELNKNINDALLSEKSLAKEWLSPEEDEAWKDL